MTPQRPWRRRWHDNIHPLLWWFLFIAVMFVAVDLCIDRADEQQVVVEQVAPPERWLIV
ncbi:hypothetical protein [Mycolicibacter virginiensis]|uniref:hypothetical protein n=1 Tax=Mycolicibacter virginiensis TaxID=1795032 RepID=UPI000B14773B|nr:MULTISPECIES: hypothetical protein [Mycobacteriaceae]